MITLDDVYDARQQITPYIARTPLVSNTTLSEQLGAQVYRSLFPSSVQD